MLLEMCRLCDCGFSILSLKGVGCNETVVVNAILYDTALEKACLDKKIPTCSQSDKQQVFTSATKLMKQHLLQLWKQHDGPFVEKTPKYKPEVGEDEIPRTPEGPAFSSCRLVDGVLVLPRDCRQEWMTDAVRAPEWRKIVQEFDRHFSTPAAAKAPPQARSESQPATAEGSGPASTPALDWQQLFGPSLGASAFQQEYAGKIKGKFAWCPELTAYLVEPTPQADDDDGMPLYQLFLEASQDYSLATTDAFLTYGAGAWLTDSKADQFLENAPVNHRGVLCEFRSDDVRVVLEEGRSFGLSLIKKHCARKHIGFIYRFIKIKSWQRRMGKMARSKVSKRLSNIANAMEWWILNWLGILTRGLLL